MTNVYVHPNILQHPGRIASLEARTGMLVVAGEDGHPRLIWPEAPDFTRIDQLLLAAMDAFPGSSE